MTVSSCTDIIDSKAIPILSILRTDQWCVRLLRTRRGEKLTGVMVYSDSELLKASEEAIQLLQQPCQKERLKRMLRLLSGEY